MIRLEDSLCLAADPVRRLGALAVTMREDAERLRDRLRLANTEFERLAAMAEAWADISSPIRDDAARALLYRLGSQTFIDSVLLAWMRTPLWIACLGALLFAVIGAVHHDWQVAGPISGVAAAAGAAWYGSYRFAQASFERAGELASLARLTPDAVALIEQRFGRTLVLD